MAVDPAGNLFIADMGNNRIRKVDAAGTITSVAGNGIARLQRRRRASRQRATGAPSGVAVDLAGDLLIADYGNNRVRKVDAAGTITTVAGNGTAGFSGDGGPATTAQLIQPCGVAVNPAGDLFIVDQGKQAHPHGRGLYADVWRRLQQRWPGYDRRRLLTLVGIALGNARPSACPNGVPSGAEVDIALILQAVNNALNGCVG